MSKNFDVSVLCVAHWMYERELEDCENEYERMDCKSCKERTINEYASEMQKLHDAESPLWLGIYMEYIRQHPFYDGKWWEEGRTYKDKRK